MLPWMVRDHRVRLPLIQLAFSLAGSLCVAVIFLAHHQGPLAATLFLLMVQAIRHLRCWQVKGRPVGIFLTRLVVILVLARIAFYIARPPSLVEAVGPERANLVKQLDAMPNMQLVIVRYAPDHFPFVEFVYNDADVDHAKIVWAREIPGVRYESALRVFSRPDHLAVGGGSPAATIETVRAPSSTEALRPSPLVAPRSAAVGQCYGRGWFSAQ